MEPVTGPRQMISITGKKINSLAYSVKSIADRKQLNAKRYPLFTKKGFTLIELLMVLSIMALILAVAAPLFIHSRRDLKLRVAANNIATSLRTARSYAITKNGEYAVDFDLEEDKFVLVYPDPENSQKRTIIEKRLKLPENIDIYNSSFLAVEISDSGDPDNGETIYRASFKPTGQFNGTNGQAVWIKDLHGKIKRIYVISTTGAVEINETPPS